MTSNFSVGDVVRLPYHDQMMVVEGQALPDEEPDLWAVTWIDGNGKEHFRRYKADMLVKVSRPIGD